MEKIIWKDAKYEFSPAMQDNIEDKDTDYSFIDSKTRLYLLSIIESKDDRKRAASLILKKRASLSAKRADSKG